MFRTAFSKGFKPQRAPSASLRINAGTAGYGESLCGSASLRLCGLKIAATVLLLVFLGCRQEQKPPSLPYYNTPDFTPQFISKEEAVKKITHTLAPFSFQNQNGQTVNSKTVEGKVHVAEFMFTSCGSICPKMTDNLKAASNAFANDSGVVFLSYTVAPWMDTKEKLKAYKTAQKITNPNWHFLTGDKGAVYTLARQSYFAEEDLGFTKDSTEFLHTEHLVLVDGSGRIRGIYNGTLALEVEQLSKDIQTLKIEMGNSGAD